MKTAAAAMLIVFLAGAAASPEPPLPGSAWRTIAKYYLDSGLVVEPLYDERWEAWRRREVVKQESVFANVRIDGATFQVVVYFGEGVTSDAVTISGEGAAALYPPPPDNALWSRLIRRFFGAGVLADYRAARVLEKKPWSGGHAYYLRGRRFTYTVDDQEHAGSFKSFGVHTHAGAASMRKAISDPPL